jgi:O-antigen ligase
MKSALNVLLLGLLAATLISAVTFFGGILPEHALPFYGFACATLLVWALKWLVCRQVSWLWTPLHGAVLLFAGYTLFRYFTSPIESSSRVDLIHSAFCAMLYFLVATNLHRPRDRIILLLVIVGLAVAQSFYALWQYKTATDQVLWLDREHDYRGRGSGTYYCPNHLAGFLEIAGGLLTGWLVAYRNPNTPLQTIFLRRLFAGAALALMGLALFTTGSRGGWIAVAATIPVMLILAEATRTIPSRQAIAGFVIFLAALGVAWSVPGIRHRVSHALNFDLNYRLGENPLEVPGGLGGRTAMWRSSVELIREHPIFGTGPGTWQWTQLRHRQPDSQLRPEFAHNDPLQLTAEYGLIGFLLMLGIFGAFYWQASQLARCAPEPEARAFNIGALAAVTAMLIHSLVDFNFHIPANALSVAVLFGLVAAQERGETKPRRHRVPVAVKLPLAVVIAVIALTLGWLAGSRAFAARLAARGMAAAQEHEWDDALRDYRAALRYDPRSPHLHELMGDVYRLQSALITDRRLRNERQLIARRGMDAYHRALELNPYHSEVMLKMAAAAELAGDPAAAFRWLERALQIDPNNAFNWIRLGVFYRRQGDLPKAVAALQRARQLNPGDWTAVHLLNEIQSPAP